MSRFRFVHAADLHLDTPFTGIARVAPEIAATMRDASLDAWDQLVELTLGVDAAFLLLAGDVYDGAERGVRAQLRLLRGLERLSERGIPTCIVHGNHDPLEGWSAIRSWPEGVTVFGSSEVGTVPIERDGERLATIHGISYERRDTAENLALRFRRSRAPGLHVGLLHANVGGDSDHARYSPCTVEDLERSGMDYWALGHIHRHTLLTEGEPWIVYPGNLQGRSPKASEQGAKGAALVEVDEGRVLSVTHRAVDRVRFHHERVAISRFDDLNALRILLLERAAALRKANADRGLLVRVTLTGFGPIHDDLGRSGVIEELIQALRDEFEADDPFLWWESVRDETRPPLEKSRMLRRDDLAGEILRFAEALRNDPTSLSAFADRRLTTLASTRLPAGIAEVGIDGARIDGAPVHDLDEPRVETEVGPLFRALPLVHDDSGESGDGKSDESDGGSDESGDRGENEAGDRGENEAGDDDDGDDESGNNGGASDQARQTLLALLEAAEDRALERLDPEVRS